MGALSLSRVNLDVIDKLSHFLFGIKSGERWVSLEFIIGLVALPRVKALRIAVVKWPHIRQDLVLFAKMIGPRPPEESHGLIRTPPLLIIMIKPTEEHGIKAHLCKQSGIGIRVSKGVNVPADSWLYSKLLIKELVAHHHVVDNVIEVRGCFVIGRPTSVHDL